MATPPTNQPDFDEEFDEAVAEWRDKHRLREDDAVIREAGATIVAAAQSTTSLVPPLGNDKSRVLTLNLRNRLIFRAADEADAVQAADFIGKMRVVKRSWGFSAGKRNVNYSETEEHRIKPHKLRNLRDHECVLVHCERGFRRVTLAPLEADGAKAKWFPWWRRMV
jgi:type IV secretory pathway TraG/TraD family ATPase VirD4